MTLKGVSGEESVAPASHHSPREVPRRRRSEGSIQHIALLSRESRAKLTASESVTKKIDAEIVVVICPAAPHGVGFGRGRSQHEPVFVEAAQRREAVFVGPGAFLPKICGRKGRDALYHLCQHGKVIHPGKNFRIARRVILGLKDLAVGCA
jgi:hypothetical protein